MKNHVAFLKKFSFLLPAVSLSVCMSWLMLNSLTSSSSRLRSNSSMHCSSTCWYGDKPILLGNHFWQIRSLVISSLINGVSRLLWKSTGPPTKQCGSVVAMRPLSRMWTANIPETRSSALAWNISSSRPAIVLHRYPHSEHLTMTHLLREICQS